MDILKVLFGPQPLDQHLLKTRVSLKGFIEKEHTPPKITAIVTLDGMDRRTKCPFVSPPETASPDVVQNDRFVLSTPLPSPLIASINHVPLHDELSNATQSSTYDKGKNSVISAAAESEQFSELRGSTPQSPGVIANSDMLADYLKCVLNIE